MACYSLFQITVGTKRLTVAEKGCPTARIRLNMIAMEGTIQFGTTGFTAEASEDRQIEPLLAAESPSHRQVCLSHQVQCAA
jgi:hypothetical protein